MSTPMTESTEGGRRLCTRCSLLDLRKLLLATQAASGTNEKVTGLVRSTTTTATAKPSHVHECQERFFEQHQSLSDLKSSSNTCDLCSAIWTQFCRQRSQHELTDDALRQGVGARPILLGTLPLDAERNAIPYVVAVQYSPPPQSGSRQLACFEPCVSDAEGNVPYRHLLGRLQAISSTDEQCFSLARQWLRTCMETHHECDQRATASLKFPTRILEVTTLPHPDAATPAVRLVSGDGHDEPYVALSYCWGGPQVLTLNKATELELRQGVVEDRFPGTIRDAIIVTRKLGLRYLWIDALCIRQDSDEDKGREISRMRDVYRGSMVTLEAASAAKAADGFLKERRSSRPYCQLSWGERESGVSVHLRPLFDISDNQLLLSTLYTRGWTLQERLLPPRTLSFGDQQISFECCRGFVDESGRTSDLPRATEAYLSKKTLRELRAEQKPINRAWRYACRILRLPSNFEFFGTRWYTQNIVAVPGGYSATYYDYWRSVVQRFNERQLTVASDRLPAVGGLAKEMQSGTNDVYIAGHWHSEIIRSLNWSCGSLYDINGAYGPGKHQSPISPSKYVEEWPDGIKSRQYIAPSWSWASCRGDVAFWDGTYQKDLDITTIARLVGYASQTVFGDPFGAVKNAHIDLSAPFLTIPDPQTICDPTYPLATFHAQLRDLARMDSASAPEFFQHHNHHQGQEFAVIQLELDNGQMGTNDFGMLVMLLIESCGDGTFRRLSRALLPWTKLREYAQAQIPHSDGSPEDERYIAEARQRYDDMIALADVVAAAPWEQKTVTLV